MLVGPALDSLHLGGCERTTDDGLRQLARHTGNSLSGVVLPHCAHGITAKGLVDYITASPRLRHVGLSRMSYVTDAVVSALRHCPNLQSLDIGGCEGIERNVLKALFMVCTRLQHLRAPRVHVPRDACRVRSVSSVWLKAYRLTPHSTGTGKLRAHAASSRSYALCRANGRTYSPHVCANEGAAPPRLVRVGQVWCSV